MASPSSPLVKASENEMMSGSANFPVEQPKSLISGFLLNLFFS